MKSQYVICTDAVTISPNRLTKGKTYKVLERRLEGVKVSIRLEQDDKGIPSWWHETRFVYVGIKRNLPSGF